MIELNGKMKDKICECLSDYDSDIVEIVQFCSSVYAPKYARDLDLIIVTKDKRDYGGYLDCLDDLDLPFNVDVIVKEVKAKLKSSFACHVLGAFEILYGDGRYLREMTEEFDPTFEEAKAALDSGRKHIEDK